MTTALSYATPGNVVRFGVLAVSNVSFAYGDYRAVDDVSFQLVPGERVALVGPNGCGKSTVLRLILGSLTPSRGAVTIDGQSPRALGRIGMARRMALVPQLAGPNAADLGSAGYTVRQIVLMARFAHHARGGGVLGSFVALGFENEADLRAADIAMWNADVHHLAGRTLDTLSGGERQRVAIARAMAQETPIVLLDEPTSALDLYHQLELLAQLEAMTGAGGGKGILMVTHDLQLAQRCATRVLLMDRGKLVVDGPPGEVLTAKYLEEVYRVRVVAGGAAGGLRFERMSGSGG